jgi:hypothetical protein
MDLERSVTEDPFPKNNPVINFKDPRRAKKQAWVILIGPVHYG